MTDDPQGEPSVTYLPRRLLSELRVRIFKDDPHGDFLEVRLQTDGTEVRLDRVLPESHFVSAFDYIWVEMGREIKKEIERLHKAAVGEITP